MKKILFSDMDGTIIDRNEKRHENDYDLLHQLKKAGHLIAFNTGRNYQEAHFCVDKHQFPYDYLVLNNGAHIIDRQGKELFKRVIPQDIGRKIIEYCIDFKDLFVYFYDGNRTIGYCNQKTYEHTDLGNEKIDDVDFMEEYVKASEFDIIAVYQADEGIDCVLKVQKYIKDHFSDFAEGCLNTHYLDITAAGCSKGSGILTLKNLLNEDVETYCVGDSFNDISMFKVSDHAYTFHHVNKDIFQYADKQVNYVYEVVEDMLGGNEDGMAR